MQPTYICLQAIMLENTKYDFGREYEFYATIPSGQKSKEGTAILIRKERPHQKS